MLKTHWKHIFHKKCISRPLTQLEPAIWFGFIFSLVWDPQMAIWVKIGGSHFKSPYRKPITNCHFCSIFQVRVNSINRKPLQIVHHVDVAIKSYAISILTGSTFDGFIDCTRTKRYSLSSWRVEMTFLSNFLPTSRSKCST